MGRNDNAYVGVCTKICFGSRKAAFKALRQINAKPDNNLKTPLKSVHYCEEHKAWHLSSMTIGLAKAIQEKKEARETLKNPTVNTIQNRIEYLKKVPRIRNKFDKL